MTTLLTVLSVIRGDLTKSSFEIQIPCILRKNTIMIKTDPFCLILINFLILDTRLPNVSAVTRASQKATFPAMARVITNNVTHARWDYNI